MKITKSHLKSLKASKKYKGKERSAISTYLLAWKAHLINIAIFILFAYLAYRYNGIEYAFFVLGGLFCLLIRDFAWHRMLAKFWPINDAITDWEKVNKIIDENET